MPCLVVHEPPIALPPHQAALAQTLEVHGGIRLAEPRPGHDLARAQRPVAQRGEYPEAREVDQAGWGLERKRFSPNAM